MDRLFFEEAPQDGPYVESYANADYPPALQPDAWIFWDSGEAEQTSLGGGYANTDNVPATPIVFSEGYEDWSPVVPDYQFNHFANVDAPSASTFADTEQDWSPPGEPLHHWWSESVGPDLPPQPQRQEGDDDSILFADYLGYDGTLDTRDDDDVVGPNFVGPATLIMPALIGLPFQEAAAIVAALPCVMQPPQMADTVYPFTPPSAGIVIEQSPLPGASIIEDSDVELVVSSGLVRYPNMSGARVANAPNQFQADDTPP